MSGSLTVIPPPFTSDQEMVDWYLDLVNYHRAKIVELESMLSTVVVYLSDSQIRDDQRLVQQRISDPKIFGEINAELMAIKGLEAAIDSNTHHD